MKPAVRLLLSSRWNASEPREYGWDEEVAEYELAAAPATDDLAAALDLVAAMHAPAGDGFVTAKLTELRLATLHRDLDGADMRALIKAYTHRLREYPVDVIGEAINRALRTQKFWPALPEITAIADRLLRPRATLKAALERGYVAQTPSPEWLPPGAGEKEGVAAYLEAHGLNPALATIERPSPAEPMIAADRRRVMEECAGRPKMPVPIFTPRRSI